MPSRSDAPSAEPAPARTRRGGTPRLVAGTVAVVATIVVSSVLIGRMDAGREHVLTSRLEARHATATQFVSAYVAGVLAHEQRLAGLTMNGEVSAELFNRIILENGFRAAVLLDAQGRVLAVAPAAPNLLGKPLPRKYAHLQRALAGEQSVSDVVPSAAKAEPIIAFAAPFDTATGRRVFSSGYRVDDTPLTAFTRNTLSFNTSRALIIDGSGTVIASSDPAVTPGADLTARTDLFAAAAKTGHHRIAGRDNYAIVGQITGTTWRLVFTVDTSELLAPVGGSGRWVPWGILAAYALAAVGALLFWRRAQLAHTAGLVYQRQLHELAMSDPLTGLANRRVALDRLRQALARGKRAEKAVAVLYIDVDKFKAINDRFGHAAGDAVLIAVGDRLRSTFRIEDTIARLGGDEFAVICEDWTDIAAVDVLVRRTRHALRQAYVVGAVTISAEASVGVTIGATGESPEVILARADGLMYDAKAEREIWPIVQGEPRG